MKLHQVRSLEILFVPVHSWYRRVPGVEYILMISNCRMMKTLLKFVLQSHFHVLSLFVPLFWHFFPLHIPLLASFPFYDTSLTSHFFFVFLYFPVRNNVSNLISFIRNSRFCSKRTTEENKGITSEDHCIVYWVMHTDANVSITTKFGDLEKYASQCPL